MFDRKNFADIQHRIAQMAGDQKKAVQIVQALSEVNWQQVFSETSSQTCLRCRTVFPATIANANSLCPECEKYICGLCRLPTLNDAWRGQYYKVICQSCLTRRGIDVEWTRSESIKVTGHETRARRLGQIGSLFFRDWLITLEDFNWKCAYCQTLPYEALDHFIPITKGGHTLPTNCIPSCGLCNSKKGQRYPDKIKSIPFKDIERVRSYLANKR